MSGFYVGYLPMPRGHGRFLAVAVPALVGGVVAAGGVIAASQRDPGDGVWQNAELARWTGTLAVDPYPVLFEEGTGRAFLLVEVGKVGAREGVRAHAGARVTVTGWPLDRDGRSMIELAPGDEGVQPAGGAGAAAPGLILGDAVELAGEVLDGKCYLGAMKPGDGKGHKACATLCVRGGVPPMLFTRDGGGPRCLLVVGSELGPANEEVLELLGEPVVVRGRAGTMGSLDVVVLEAGGVRRR